MQKFCYHSCINELKLEGIQGKVFVEIACGPCSVGKALAKNGAKKVYGIDISEQMIEQAKSNINFLGLQD